MKTVSFMAGMAAGMVMAGAALSLSEPYLLLLCFPVKICLPFPIPLSLYYHFLLRATLFKNANLFNS